MRNEELAVLAQGGDREALMNLWSQVNRLVLKYANRWAAFGRGGVTVEDLCQAGFIALLRAVDSYDPGKAMFSTHLYTYLRAEFTEATGQRSPRTQRDPLHSAVSLDALLADGNNDEGSDIELCNTISDSAAEDAFLDVEHEELRSAVLAAVDALPECQRTAILARYFGKDGKKQNVRVAMQNLRRNHAWRLKSYL